MKWTPADGVEVRYPSDDMMVPDRQAAEIAAISRQRLRYWEKTDLIKPDIEREISPRNVVRLYSLPRLVELVAASELRYQGVSLQHIRRIISHLRTQGYEAPLREVRFALSGDRVLFQHANGAWEDSRRPFQGVMWQVVDLAAIRSRVQGRLERSSADSGVVEKRRKVQASKLVFRGTRVPVEAVRGYLQAGKTPLEILEAFPSLTVEDVKAVEAQLTSVA
jgi:DNA-binding transcriptional MerR regulator